MRLGHAKHLPSMDVASESDVFVVMVLLDGHGHVVTSAKWPVKWDANNPVWNSCRPLGKALLGGAGMRVRLKLYDHDEAPLGKLQRSELIGTASIALSELRIGEAPSSLPVVLKRSKLRRASALLSTKPTQRPFITLGRVAPEEAPPRKTVYLVRHGESVWNAAQASKDVVAMMSAVDHPLNDTGRGQAESLARHLAAGGSEAEEVMKATLVVCSPLTRAIQTCLVGLAPLLAHEGSGARSVQLNPNAREKRNFGGKDSSGKHVGDEITADLERSMYELYPAAGKAEELLRWPWAASTPCTCTCTACTAPTQHAHCTCNAYARPQLDLELVQTQWWLGQKEEEAHVVARTDELLAQLRYCEATSIVLVGHSHYFRELFRNFMPETAQSAAPELLKKKLSNGGMVAVDLNWADQPEKPVASVRLLFDTELVD